MRGRILDLFSLLFAFSTLPPTLLAESLSVSSGPGRISFVASAYKPKTVGSFFLSAAYARPIFGPWSAQAQFQTDIGSRSQGFTGGFTYDWTEAATRSATLNINGTLAPSPH